MLLIKINMHYFISRKSIISRLSSWVYNCFSATFGSSISILAWWIGSGVTRQLVNGFQLKKLRNSLLHPWFNQYFSGGHFFQI